METYSSKHSILYTLYSIRYTLYSILYTLYPLPFTLPSLSADYVPSIVEAEIHLLVLLHGQQLVHDLLLGAQGQSPAKAAQQTNQSMKIQSINQSIN